MNMRVDNVGDTLRSFYAVFGVAGEGPPEGLDVTACVGPEVKDADLDVLRGAVGDAVLRGEFARCRQILDEIATLLTGDGLLRELSAHSVQAEQFDQLTNGVFWFALASALDQRKGGMPSTPLDDQVQLPVPLRIRLAVQGSLILRLYLALVYMREGPLAELIARAAKQGAQCAGLVQRLLNSDYVRHVRNALAHGTFVPSIAGIVFRDEARQLPASPGFLGFLCTELMLIQLQSVAATMRSIPSEG